MEVDIVPEIIIKDLFLSNLITDVSSYNKEYDENTRTTFINIYRLKGIFNVNLINEIMVEKKYYNHEIFFYPRRVEKEPNVVIMIKKPNYIGKLNKVSNFFYYSSNDNDLNKSELKKHKDEFFFGAIEKIYFSFQILDVPRRYQTLINVKTIDPSNGKTIMQLMYPHFNDLSISLFELNKMINNIEYINNIEINTNVNSIDIILQKDKKRKREEKEEKGEKGEKKQCKKKIRTKIISCDKKKRMEKEGKEGKEEKEEKEEKEGKEEKEEKEEKERKEKKEKEKKILTMFK